MRDYLATPDLARRAARLPAYSPDFNPDEAFWARAREEVTANTCLGTRVQVQERTAAFFAGLPSRTDEVQSRCSRASQALADPVAAPALESHQEAPHVDLISAPV